MEDRPWDCPFDDYPMKNADLPASQTKLLENNHHWWWGSSVIPVIPKIHKKNTLSTCGSRHPTTTRHILTMIAKWMPASLVGTISVRGWVMPKTLERRYSTLRLVGLSCFDLEDQKATSCHINLSGLRLHEINNIVRFVMMSCPSGRKEERISE